MPVALRSAVNAITGLVLAAVTWGCTTGPEVAGHVCIVFDIRNPGQCGAMQLVAGLRVVEVESANHTTTDGNGNFSVAIPARATSAVLRIAEDRADRRTSIVGVDVATAGEVLTPVITTTLWNTYLTALHLSEDPALATIHVAFPSPGAYVGSAQVDGAAQLIFNQGEAFAWANTPPGDQTIVLMALGVAADTGTAMVKVVSRSDEVLYNAPVPVQAGAITWLQIGS